MYKKIMVPLDGSKFAASALPHVVELAKAFSSQVIVFHSCASAEDAGMADAYGSVRDAADTAEHKVCETFLNETAQELKEKGVDVEAVCVTGNPPRAIIGYADKNSVDLIVMATHGKGEVAWVLGSVAEKVVSHATVPVLLHRVVERKQPILGGEMVGMP